MDELLYTEDVYVNFLRILIDLYVLPLRGSHEQAIASATTFSVSEHAIVRENQPAWTVV